MRDDKRLCRNFCKYYRPEKNETFECRGAVLVRRLIQAGRRVSLGLIAGLASPSSAAAAALRSRMCEDCGFFAEDCDFITTGGAAAPCGGFLILARLLDQGGIAKDELDGMRGP